MSLTMRLMIYGSAASLLLTLCLALPATAAPLHCALPLVTASSHAHHGKSDIPLEQAPKHDCIGCIASFAVAAPLTTTAPPPVARQKLLNAPQVARSTSGPDTPPPRPTGSLHRPWG